MHIVLFIKVFYSIPILLKKKLFYPVFLRKLLFRWAKEIFDYSILLKLKVYYWLIYEQKLK